MRIVFLIIFGLFASSIAYAEDKKLPPLVLTDAKGAEIRLDTRTDTTHIINFWATWCAPCVHELPSLVALARHYEDNEAVQIVLINEDLNHEKAQDFLQNFDFPTKTLRLFDHKGKFLRAIGGKGLPITIITDPTGAVLHRTIGPRDWNTTEVHALIEG